MGSVTKYNYDTVTKLLKYVENANGKQTAYSYDTRDRVSSVYLDADKDGVKDSYEYAVEYLYAQNRLSGINTATTQYTLTYDAFGNMLSIKAGDNTLATYTYSGNNGKLQKLEYGNGDFETYEYDHLDRLVKVYYNGNEDPSYFVIFDTNGRVSSVKDGNTTHVYEYDSLGRLIRAYQKDNDGTTLLAVENTYDEYGRALGSTYVAGDKTMSYTLSYKTDSSLVSHISMPSAVVSSGIAYTYDEFDRLISKDISLSTSRDLYTDYEYYTYTKTVDEELKTFTTALVSKLTLSVSSNGTAETVEYGYTYDKLGNILSISKNGTVINEYEYDALGQLVCEEYPVDNLAYVYTYDKAGNITSKQKYPYNANAGQKEYTLYLASQKETIATYGYSTSSWGDMLTNYNGTAITYDAIGNPNNWRNAASMSWDKRELSSLTLNDNGTLNFVYNSDGIRTQKTYINGETTTVHNYVLDGTNVINETVTENGVDKYTLYYLYDSSGSISGFIYNNNPFYFQKNLQGDIVRILNPAGAVVAEYAYDAWGNVLSVTGSLATTIGQINPFRYRGYYYDTETGFYYLQSRYYDPTVGRFLNADSFVSTGQGILGNNMFAYCNNNPVVMSDHNGYEPSAALKTIPALLELIGAVDGPGLAADLIGLLLVGTVILIYESENIMTFPRFDWSKIFEKELDDELVITDDIVVEDFETRKEEITPYQEADLINGEVVIGRYITQRDAYNRVLSGMNVICRDYETALVFATSISGTDPFTDAPLLIYEINCIQRPGYTYYPHFHIKGGPKSIHIWHYGPVNNDAITKFTR